MTGYDASKLTTMVEKITAGSTSASGRSPWMDFLPTT